MSMFAYKAGGEEGGGLEVLKCFVRGGQNFSLLCVCGGGGWGWGWGGQVQYLSFREKDNRPPPVQNK